MIVVIPIKHRGITNELINFIIQFLLPYSLLLKWKVAHFANLKWNLKKKKRQLFYSSRQTHFTTLTQQVKSLINLSSVLFYFSTAISTCSKQQINSELKSKLNFNNNLNSTNVNVYHLMRISTISISPVILEDKVKNILHMKLMLRSTVL